MFVDPQLHLYLLGFVSVLYFSVPPRMARVRQWLLVAVSFSVVFYAAPVAALLGSGLSVFAFFVGLTWQNNPPSRPAVAVAVAIPIAVILAFEFVMPTTSLFEKIGSSYFAIKTITVLIDCKRGQLTPSLAQVFLLNLWFPIYSAGPIERAATFDQEKFSKRFDIQDFFYGGSRIAFGLLKTTYLVNSILSPWMAYLFGDVQAVVDTSSPINAYGFILLNFLMVYVGFSGYTDIAIGSSRIFGLRVRENFDMPLLATSIQNFWQRWHLSLAQTVSNYLFLPFVRSTGRPALAIFVAFVVIGLWHQVSATYFCWGLLHGGALAFHFRYSRFAAKREILAKIHEHPLAVFASRVITISYVSWVSAFANAPDFETALSLSLTLVGLH